ncbi:hypothetical protein B0H13DRAFT_2374915 [Mycena leptocephala]|nr:hypothetical protein B0H13DRAFT_2374915 [Mycena leptocephala]
MPLPPAYPPPAQLLLPFRFPAAFPYPSLAAAAYLAATWILPAWVRAAAPPRPPRRPSLPGPPPALLGRQMPCTYPGCAVFHRLCSLFSLNRPPPRPPPTATGALFLIHTHTHLIVLVG